MAAQKATITTASPITWSNGALFNGYLILAMTFPSDEIRGAWAKATLAGANKLRVPEKVKLPILDGVFVSPASVWRTDSLVPPNIQYTQLFYDETDMQVYADAETPLTITTATYTLPQPSPTAPVAG